MSENEGGEQPQSTEPIELPDDHPLVKTLAAQKEQIKELKAQAAAEVETLKQQLDAKPAGDGLEARVAELQQQLDAEIAARQQAEASAAEASLAQLRTDRAAAKGLPAALAKKLVGTTEEELDTEIDELLPLLGSGPKPNPQQGNPSLARGGSLSAGRERFTAKNTP